MDKMIELLELVVIANAVTGNDYMYSYSGHTNYLEVRYYKGGFEDDKEFEYILDLTDVMAEGAETKVRKAIKVIKSHIADVVVEEVMKHEAVQSA